MVETFDKTTKPAFRTPNDPQYIRFGSVRDRDTTRGIRAGSLKLEGHTIAEFFEPSIQCIVDAAIEQKYIGSRPVTTVFLVGGFAANDYLFSHVEESLRGHGFKVHRPDEHLNKAVSDGSIAGYLRPVIRTRVTKYTYGNKCSFPYNDSHPEHRKRTEKCYGDLNGDIRVGGGFDQIIEKNRQISESQEIRVAFCYQELRKESIAKSKVVQVTCYRGDIEQPEFVDQDPENFHDTCAVRADLTNLVAGLQPRIGETGIVYFEINYEIIVFFGSAEFKVQLGWEENGVEKRGPVEILFDTGI